MRIKEIEGFEGYFITDTGELYSNKKGSLVRKSTHYSRNGYECCDLYMNNIRTKKMIHRLVAEAFISKPEGCNVINHKDRNTKNNNYVNLEWTTQQANIHYSYKTMGPIRNYRECKLLKGNREVGKFKSINEACRFAEKEYGASYSTLNKYRKTGDLEIVK